MALRKLAQVVLVVGLVVGITITVESDAPNSGASCSIQHDGFIDGGYTVTGKNVQANEEVAVSIETPYNSYGTLYTTSSSTGTFVVYGYTYGNPGLYSASITLHRYSKPVASCSANL